MTGDDNEGGSTAGATELMDASEADTREEEALAGRGLDGAVKAPRDARGTADLPGGRWDTVHGPSDEKDPPTAASKFLQEAAMERTRVKETEGL